MSNATEDDPDECASKDCIMPPTMECFLVLRRRNVKAAAPAKTGMKFCGACALEIKLDDILTDESWKQISDGFAKAGKARPDRELCEVDMVPLRME